VEVARKSSQHPLRTLGLSTAIGVLLAVSLAVGTSGCVALPALGAIPSLISMIHELGSSKSGDAGNPPALPGEPEDAEAEAESVKPPPKLTEGNVCQMIAISHPGLVVVELRKGAAGAPEYRELRLVNSTDDASWTPIVSGETGPNGWRPAVNFLKMDFRPPLTGAIPDTGSSYLAYVPVAPESNDPNQEAKLQSTFGGAVGAFTWDGRVYAYTVAPTVPCLSSSSLAQSQSN
jgi:hypothetical protein